MAPAVIAPLTVTEKLQRHQEKHGLLPPDESGVQSFYNDLAVDYADYVRVNDWIAPEVCTKKFMSHLPCSRPSPYRLLDVGCGTGLAIELVKKAWAERNLGSLYSVGVDLSAEMLNEAKKKNLYDEYVEMDIGSQKLKKLGQFDGLIACGVFLQTHCGPDSMANVLNMIKPGGFASVTIREVQFDNVGTEYIKAFEEARCTVVTEEVGQYRTVEGKAVEGRYIVLNKRA